MSWYLRIRDRATGDIVYPEYRDISFTQEKETFARTLVKEMNAVSTVYRYELMKDDARLQSTFKFTPETAETRDSALLLPYVKARRPILLVGSPAMFKETKGLK